MKLTSIRPIALVLARELMITGLLLIGVSFVVFIILYLSPGDPFSVLLEGQMPTESAREGIREAIGVQKAWYGQYLSWLVNMLQGNFGNSTRTGLCAGRWITSREGSLSRRGKKSFAGC